LQQPLVHQGFDEPSHLAGAELRLRLPLELGLCQLHRDDGREPLSHIVARDILVAGLAALRLLLDVATECARQRCAEPDEVRTAFDGVDVVREGVDGLVVRIVVLERNFDGDRHLALALLEAALARDQDRRRVERLART
jgi:hypothetical protein